MPGGFRRPSTAQAGDPASVAADGWNGTDDADAGGRAGRAGLRGRCPAGGQARHAAARGAELGSPDRARHRLDGRVAVQSDQAALADAPDNAEPAVSQYSAENPRQSAEADRPSAPGADRR